MTYTTIVKSNEYFNRNLKARIPVTRGIIELLEAIRLLQELENDVLDANGSLHDLVILKSHAEQYAALSSPFNAELYGLAQITTEETKQDLIDAINAVIGFDTLISKILEVYQEAKFLLDNVSLNSSGTMTLFPNFPPEQQEL